MAGEHQRRVADQELGDLLEALPAVSIEGPRAVGKTWTASRLANTVHALDDPETLAEVQADPQMVVQGEPPVLIDEWQRFPASWDIVRRAVDRDFSPGRFILTGSTRPEVRPAHSGAGRIVTLRMWTTTLSERHAGQASVSLKRLLAGDRPEIEGQSEMGMEDYAAEIVGGGFPGWRNVSGRARGLLADGYLHHLAEHDFPLMGRSVRNPAALRRWLVAYAAASSSTAAYETIRDAATADESDKPAKSTTIAYRDTLEAMWVLDPLPAWLPVGSHLSRLKRSPKHQRGVLAVEVKRGAEVTGHDTRHRRWLRDRLGPALTDAMVVTTGSHAYRDEDGIAIVPAALLAP